MFIIIIIIINAINTHSQRVEVLSYGREIKQWPVVPYDKGSVMRGCDVFLLGA